MCSTHIVTSSAPSAPISRRDVLTAAAASVASLVASTKVGAQASHRKSIPATHLVDLTHPLDPAFPYIPIQGLTHGFRSKAIATIPTNGVYSLEWQLIEHIGTHIDAPSHFNA